MFWPSDKYHPPFGPFLVLLPGCDYGETNHQFDLKQNHIIDLQNYDNNMYNKILNQTSFLLIHQ